MPQPAPASDPRSQRPGPGNEQPSSPAPRLRDAWESQSEPWAAWARTPDHDYFFWRYNLPSFLELVPQPGSLTVDVGCGEGRVGRALMARGHRVLAIDAAPTLARLTATHAVAQTTGVADAAALPLRAEIADVAIAFMSLQDVDDLDTSVKELSRVLRPKGTLCIAVLHPLVTAGHFVSDETDSPFVVARPYPEPYRLIQPFERDGLKMVFHSIHRPLSAYAEALYRAGLKIELLSEPVPDDDTLRDYSRLSRQRRIPWYLHLRARRE